MTRMSLAAELTIVGCLMFGGVTACSGTDSGAESEKTAPQPEASKALTAADFDAMTEQQKLDFVVNGFGWKPEEVVPDGDRVIVGGDVAISRKDVDGYIRGYLAGNMKKAYTCDSQTAGPGANGFGCFEMLATHTNSIRMVIDSAVPEIWRQAFVEAAYAISSMTLFDVNTSISIDTTGYRSNQWTINVGMVSTTEFLALSSWPTWHDVDFVAPGSLIQIQIGDTASTARRKKTAMHELLHAFGFHHPTEGNLVNLTATWTGATPDCLPAAAGKYPTVMCKGTQMANLTWLGEDDEVAGVLLYAGSNYDRNVWSNSRCTPTSPCGIGEGDCDTDNDCEGYLICSQNAHATLYGAPSGGDVCVSPSTPRNEGGAACNTALNETRCDNPACPCGAGEGDCDSWTECGSVLLCAENLNNGAAVGLSTTQEVCTHPRPAGCSILNKASPSTTFCSASCPCSYGEGDCDTDAECVGGLVCAQNVGPSFGLPADYDICVKAGVF